MSGIPVITSTQLDLMARLAYAFPVVETISVYAELLPGYSLIKPSDGDTATGFVFAFGVGGAMDLTERLFVNLGAGYQFGFQKLPAADKNAETRSSYIRVAFGIGMRF